MPNMTLSIPEELYRVIKNHPEVKWSHVARKAMWEYAKKLELMDKLLEKSTLTEEDVIELDQFIKEELHKRYEGSKQ
jgi:hypothetical protein